MNHPTDRLLIEQSYLLSEDLYADLRHIRDKLLFMTQLAGTSNTNSADDPMIFIHRSMIGEAFRDASYLLDDVLDVIATTAPRVGSSATR
jgi:hypothetical protein